MKFRTVITALLIMMLAGSAGFADGPEPVKPSPPDFNAGQLLNQNRDNLETPNLQKPADGNNVTAPEQPAVAGSAEKRKMYIRGYQVYCPVDIPADKLKEMLNPYIEIAGTTDDMQAAAGKIVEYLRKQGYFLATGAVSEQPVAEFIYPIYIYPGKISAMSIDSRSGVQDKIIAMQFGDMKNGDYIKKSQLERGMAYVNDLQGQVAQMQIAPGKNMGEYELKIISVPTKNWLSRTGIDNAGTVSLGRWEANETVLLTNLAGRGDSFGVIVSGAPYWVDNSAIRNNNIGQAYTNIWWNTPAFTAGGKFNVSVMGQTYHQWNAYSGSWPDPEGWAANLSAGYEQSLVRTPTDNLTLGLTYESKLNNDFTIYWSDAGNWVDTEVNDLVLSSKYNWSDATLGGGQNFALLSLETGYISAYDTNKRQSLQSEGYYGWYGLMSADVSRTQYLPSGFQLFVSANGQIPNEDLASSEKISVTGLNGVRAYPYALTNADIGVVGTLELQYFPEYLRNNILDGIRLSAFFDAGVMKTYFSKPYNAKIGSVYVNPYFLPVYNGQDYYGYGIGVNFTVLKAMNMSIQYALPIAPPAYLGNTYDNGQLWFSAAVTF